MIWTWRVFLSRAENHSLMRIVRSCRLSTLVGRTVRSSSPLASITSLGQRNHEWCEGSFNTYLLLRKMTWSLENTHVDLYGVLSFVPNVTYSGVTLSFYFLVYHPSRHAVRIKLRGSSSMGVTSSSMLIDKVGSKGTGRSVPFRAILRPSAPNSTS
jgi:hypothetical protein